MNEILLYKTANQEVKLEVLIQSETIWLNQKQMGELFAKSTKTINEHINNLFKEGELQKDSTIRNIRTVQLEGEREVKRDITFYNLDVIISVGYRVKSQQGVQFRIWATQILKEYIIKGFAMDDERLKNPNQSFDDMIKQLEDK